MVGRVEEVPVRAVWVVVKKVVVGLAEVAMEAAAAVAEEEVGVAGRRGAAVEPLAQPAVQVAA